MAGDVAYRILCLDPKMPDLPQGQLDKLHVFKDAILDAYNNVTVGDNKVDPDIVLSLLCVHGAAWNQNNFRNSDPKSVEVANQLMAAAQTNCDLHVKYKPPKKS